MFGKVFGRREQSEAVPPLYRPYKSDHVNKVYNLLFCDNLSLLTERNERDFSFNTVMSESVDRETLERIGNDLDVESRVRVVAFNRLRAMKLSVPTKRLLGVIIETPQPGGLDVLAAFPDGCLRYINFSEKFALLNSPTPSLAEKSAELIRVSQFIVNSIGPWNKVRRPPPRLRVNRTQVGAVDPRLRPELLARPLPELACRRTRVARRQHPSVRAQHRWTNRWFRWRRATSNVV